MSNVPALTNPAALQALIHGVAYVIDADVQGDIAEFGVFHGSSAQNIANAMAYEKNSARKLWLFDSFAGLPEATNAVDLASPHLKSGAWTWRYEHNSEFTAEQLIALLSQYLPPERIAVADGWFADTLKEIPAGTRFAMVHIDCDLYQSTYEVLDHLFANDMFSDGCAIFFDDWYCNRGSYKYGEHKAWDDICATHAAVDKFMVTDWGPYGPLGHKFIVHHA